jgi:serine protease Do
LAAALHLPAADGARGTRGAGALVASVSPDSPAAKAGLHPGDVIQAVDGKPIASPRELALGIADGQPGAVVGLGVLRDGEKQTVQVTLASQPQAEQVAAKDEAMPRPSIGVALTGITPELRDRLDLPADLKGAIIANVTPDSPADRAGLHQGDVVLGVGQNAVTSPGEAVGAIRTAARGGKTVALRILRDGQSGFIAVRPGKAPAQQDDEDEAG